MRSCAAHGLAAEKWIGQDGNEDRIVFGWHGVVGLAEIKRKGKGAAAHQAARHEEHRRRGVLVAVVDDDVSAAQFIAAMLARVRDAEKVCP